MTVQGREVLVTCPPGVQPNERVTFSIPSACFQDRPTDQSNHSLTSPAPNHQIFEVVIPDGVRPGQSFGIVVNGQRVMVTCPLNICPGQKIRFQLPIKLTTQQLDSVRVDYHKDGWMRCLGSDLNFHWVYNTATNSSLSSSPSPSSICPKLKCCQLNKHGFIRELIPPLCPRLRSTGGAAMSSHWDIRFIEASTYSMPSTVSGTKLNYTVISSVAVQPFDQKCTWLMTQFASHRPSWESGHIKLKVRRSHLLADTMDGIESLSVEDMKKIFRIEFIGESGIDAGGVMREWYELVSTFLFHPDNGLFQYSMSNQMCVQFHPFSSLMIENSSKYYHFAGRFLGKSLLDGYITPIHLISPLYKHLLGYPIMLRDMEAIDEEYYRHLIELLSVDDVSMLSLDFTVTVDCLGTPHTIPLVPIPMGQIFLSRTAI